MFVPINSLCTSLLRAFCWIIRRKYDYFAYINQRKYWTNHENARYIEVIDVTFSKLENRINRGELNIFPNFFRFFRRSTGRLTITLIAVQPSVKQGKFV